MIKVIREFILRLLWELHIKKKPFCTEVETKYFSTCKANSRKCSKISFRFLKLLAFFISFYNLVLVVEHWLKGVEIETTYFTRFFYGFNWIEYNFSAGGGGGETPLAYAADLECIWRLTGVVRFLSVWFVAN